MYFKIAWRNLIKDRQFTLLNLMGLATGLACTLLIYLWVSDERSVDKFNANDSRLYHVLKNDPNSDGTTFTSKNTQGLLAKSMAESFPEVEYAVSINKNDEQGVISDGVKNIKAKPQFADKDFFKVFSYKLIDGNKSAPLANKFGVLLSNTLALKLFNTTQNVVGKTIKWDHGDEFNGIYTIAGIYQAPPANATNQFDILFTYQLLAEKHAGQRGDLSYWGSNGVETYIVLKEGTNAKQFETKIKDFTKQKIKAVYGKSSDLVQYEGDLILQKYSDEYLYNHYENGVQSGGRIEYIKLFSVIAVFILIIACINFMNLSTAKASRRMKEVGIRKVVGAGRGLLVLQYMGESLLMAFLSLLIAVILVIVLLPPFKAITGKDISLHFNAASVLTVLGITLLTGVIAGSYPALYLSGFKPVLVLKGKLNTSAGEAWVRKGLVVFQFAISVVLIIAVLVVFKQMNLIQTKNLGYNRDNIIRFAEEGRLKTDVQTFTTEIKSIPGVVAASSMDGDMTGSYSQGGGGIEWQGKGPNDGIEFQGLYMDYGMPELLGMQIKEGRSFNRKFGNDSNNSVIFNETAIAAMKLKNPVGQTVSLWGKKKQIIGVVKDFQFESMYKKVVPFFFECKHDEDGQVFVKIRAGQEQQTLARINSFYKQFNAGVPFEYRFLDDDYQALYASEQRVAVLSRYFAGLAIIISCLGLFGLAAFTAQKRQKEIGIRKVVGATVTNVAVMLGGDFLKLVLVAVLIAFPLSWLLMHNWLQSFAYRVDIGTGIFAAAGGSIIAITLFTISFQAIKAAVANPVRSLRSE